MNILKKGNKPFKPVNRISTNLIKGVVIVLNSLK